jgi:hypothetical protein
VASNLVARLPDPLGIFKPDGVLFRNFYRKKGIFGPSFTLMPVSRKFVFDQLNGLKSGKSTGLDGLAARFLKDGAYYLRDPLAHIINMSILTETVPSGFKQARVRPIFKKGSKLDPGNYRPVSILTVLSKILERTVHGQLVSYLKEKGLLYEFQSGFRDRYSTDTCLLDLAEYIKGEFSKGNLVGMVLIDLQKAFDTVDHGVLLSKMKIMGITSLDWFSSYLTGRQQCVGEFSKGNLVGID